MTLQEKAKSVKVSFKQVPFAQKLSLSSTLHECCNYVALDFERSKAYATDGYTLIVEDFAFEGSMLGQLLIPCKIFRKLGTQFAISKDAKIKITIEDESFEFVAPSVFYPNVPRLMNRIKGTEALNVQLDSKEFKKFVAQVRKTKKSALKYTTFRFVSEKGSRNLAVTADCVDFDVHFHALLKQSVENAPNAKIIMKGSIFLNFAKITNGTFSYLQSERKLTIDGDGYTAVFMTEPDYD